MDHLIKPGNSQNLFMYAVSSSHFLYLTCYVGGVYFLSMAVLYPSVVRCSSASLMEGCRKPSTFHTIFFLCFSIWKKLQNPDTLNWSRCRSLTKTDKKKAHHEPTWKSNLLTYQCDLSTTRPTANFVRHAQMIELEALILNDLDHKERTRTLSP